MSYLAELPLFAAATEEELQMLERRADHHNVRPGARLFEPFTVTDAYWVLLEGEWRVWRRIGGKPELMFEADRPGTWTGGIPIIDAIAPPRAEILRSSHFLRVPSDLLLTLCGQNAEVGKQLLEAVNWGSGYIAGLIGQAVHSPAGKS